MESIRAGKYISGLESLRFFCALIVVFSHGLAPSISSLLPKSGLFNIVRGIYGCFYPGLFAVMIFFIISGFCIRNGMRNGGGTEVWVKFLIRRFMRIYPPLLATILIANYSGFSNSSVLWSLWCELIYYTMYPLIFVVHRRLGTWKPIILISYVLAGLVLLMHPHSLDYHENGIICTTLLGLPAWISGCILADFYNLEKRNSFFLKTYFWLLTALLYLFGIFGTIVKFHAGIGYPWTATLFTPLATFWFLIFIGYCNSNRTMPLLEWAGRWSYSLYLTHPLSIEWFKKSLFQYRNSLIGFFFETSVVIAIAILFYYLIEYPSHQTSRKMSHWFSKNLSD